ncbi:ABC-three component system protein [Lysinibacillus xylanilyticus]|uniref:ABC-three component system protein n=1 Tax=Lysinibacillus xylanilyticus TaxID=582475 RepID=UPI003D07DE19
MDRAVNDATLVKAGDIFQYYIALRDCFKMKKGDKIQIEINGDVSLISDKSNVSFQREVKHHFGISNLSDRDVEFWKTLSNWYMDFDRIKLFSHLILHTTSGLSSKSSFYEWNDKKPVEKIKILESIGKINKEKEVTFRSYYNKIFSKDLFDEGKLLNILERFTIEFKQNNITAISEEFSSYIGHIPENNRDNYIGALLGRIISLIKEPPHCWEITKEGFDEILQQESPAYSNPNLKPFPNEFSEKKIPEQKVKILEQKNFVSAIRTIEFDNQIANAVSDYWKTEMTLVKYFTDDFLYLNSLSSYKDELQNQLSYTKEEKILLCEDMERREVIKHSKLLYLGVMKWNAIDFGSIVGNQGYFQRGIIHTIVDENEFSWDVGEGNEY